MKYGTKTMKMETIIDRQDRKENGRKEEGEDQNKRLLFTHHDSSQQEKNGLKMLIIRIF